MGSLLKIIGFFILLSVLSAGLGAKLFSPEVWSAMKIAAGFIVFAFIAVGLYGVASDIGKFGRKVSGRGRRGSGNNIPAESQDKAEMLDTYFAERRKARFTAPPTGDASPHNEQQASRSSVSTANAAEYDDDLIDVDDISDEGRAGASDFDDNELTEVEIDDAFQRTLLDIRGMKETDPAKWRKS